MKMANMNRIDVRLKMILNTCTASQLTTEHRLLVLDKKFNRLTKLCSEIKSNWLKLETFLESESKDRTIIKEKVQEKETKIKEMGNNMKEHQDHATQTGEDEQNEFSEKNFTFEEKVEGKNVMIGNEVAAVSEGGPLEFAKPLPNEDDPNALVNKTAKLPDSDGAGVNVEDVSGDLADLDGKFVGNESVNIQKNEQNIFLSGDPSTIKVDKSGEPVKYSKADQDELSRIVQQLVASTASGENEISLSESEEKTLNRALITRIANFYQERQESEIFMGLCHSLVKLSNRQRRSLAPNLCGITCIDLTNASIELNSLSAFFACFKDKTFHQVLLRNNHITANNIQVLAASLGSCKIEVLEMSFRLFESMGFLNMVFLLPHVECLVLRNLTSAYTNYGNAFSSQREFSKSEAKQLSLSILDCNQVIKLDLRGCDLTNFEIALELSKCLPKVSSLSLKYGVTNKISFKTLASGVTEMHKIDLAGVDLRNVGSENIAALFTKVKILILNDVSLDDKEINNLLTELKKSPETAIDALDLSYNKIHVSTVSKILAIPGKVKLYVFSKDQLNYTKHSKEIDQNKVLISKVVNGKESRAEKTDEADASLPTHWIACAKPVNDHIRSLIVESTHVDRHEKNAKDLENYVCMNCKEHIAFSRDQTGPLSHSIGDDCNEVLVSWASACVPCEDTAVKRHTCADVNCSVYEYEMKDVECAACSQYVGIIYQNKKGRTLWGLFKDYNSNMLRSIERLNRVKLQTANSGRERLNRTQLQMANSDRERLNRAQLQMANSDRERLNRDQSQSENLDGLAWLIGALSQRANSDERRMCTLQ